MWNAEQVTRIVCKLVLSTSFLMIRGIGSVGTFRVVMKQENCARLPEKYLRNVNRNHEARSLAHEHPRAYNTHPDGDTKTTHLWIRNGE